MEHVALVTEESIEVRSFFDRYAGAVLRLCRRITGNDADAEDARQETFLQLQRHYGRLEPADNPAGWLFRTATNASLQILRNRKRPAPAPRSAEEPFLLDREEELAKVARAIDALPAEYRAVVVERFRHGRGPSEIARRLRIPAGRVRVQLCRALQLLRERVGRTS